jgi:hypothetical protein
MTQDLEAGKVETRPSAHKVSRKANGTTPGANCLPFRTLQELMAEDLPKPSSTRISDEDRERYSAFTRHCFSKLKAEILNPELSETLRFERCIRHYVCCLLHKGVTIETMQDHSGEIEGVSVYALYYLILSAFLDYLSHPGPPISPKKQVERNFAWCTAVLWGRRWRLSHRVQ